MKRNFLFFLFLGLIVTFLAVSCDDFLGEKTNGPTAPVSKISAAPLSGGTESLPAWVKWHWRRVQLEGNLSSYGDDNINGSFGTVTGHPANSSYESGYGQSPYDWIEVVDHTSITRNTTSPQQGAYNVRVINWGYLGGCQIQNGFYSVNIGTTIVDDDSITFNGWFKDIAYDGSATLTLRTYYRDGTNCGDYSKRVLGPMSSWTEITDKRIATYGDLGYIRWKISGSDGSTVYPDYSADNFRLYSSASELTPPFRCYPNGSPYYYENGGKRYIKGSFNHSNWATTGTGTVQFFYEDDRDGLYYPATTGSTSFSTWYNNPSTIQQEISSDFWSYLTTYQEARVLIRTHLSGYTDHINEFDTFIFDRY